MEFIGSQLELVDEFVKQREKYNKAMPDLTAKQMAAWDETYKDGALSTKVKRLMAMCVALRAGCTGCILGQTIRAVEAGATREEVLEAIGVATAVSGTTAFAESYRIMKLLDEMGK